MVVAKDLVLNVTIAHTAGPDQHKARCMKVRGFTLIELMIVVVVIAIIAAIAFPAYQNQVQKTRRADAHTALLGAAQTLERCFTRTNSYEGCNFPTTSPDEFYTLEPDEGDEGEGAITATTFRIRAVAQPPQDRDTACATMTIDHLGRREAVPGDDRCWGS